MPHRNDFDRHDRGTRGGSGLPGLGFAGHRRILSHHSSLLVLQSERESMQKSRVHRTSRARANRSPRNREHLGSAGRFLCWWSTRG